MLIARKIVEIVLFRQRLSVRFQLSYFQVAETDITVSVVVNDERAVNETCLG
jgi:hypothetical protein